MSGGVADDGPLDYARIQIIPSENRYEAFVCCDNEVDALTEGNLDALLLHLPELLELNAKGSKASIKLQPPASSAGTTWFTKSTLRRFLRIVGSPELPNIMKTMNEMSQLEEAKRFQLSLYGQGQISKTEEKDRCNLDCSSPEHRSGPEFASSAASKNDLLRAMDLRLTALNKDLTAAFEKTCGATCSSKEISHLAKFTEHFGAINLKNCTYKYLELNPKSDTVELINDDNKHLVTSNLSNENAISVNGSVKAEKSYSSTLVQYGVSPAKVAQIERQDSSETESSDSDNENGTPAERSRTMVRSAVARRSASPMRRVQIGRTGSRRAPAIMIRSLNHLQTRDNMFSQGDAAANSGDDEEGSEPSSKTADNNVGRISVQDAISLFESKQKSDASDVQKRRSLANITVSANKFVLRRWSTGMGETSPKCKPELVSDDSSPISHHLTEGVPKSKFTDEEVGSDKISSIDETCTTADVEVKLENLEIRTSDPPETQADSPASKPQEVVQKLSANAEWTRRKEAELDQMLKKVMESKRVAQKNSQANRKKDVNFEQRGELYDQYKAKRDEKRRAEEGKGNTTKEPKIKGTRQVADDRRSKIASSEVSVTKKRVTRKPEVPSANLSKSEKPKKEISKPSTIEKISSRTKPMATTRKSWPSSASERTTGISPASSNATRQKAQPVSSNKQLSAKAERSPIQKKNVKETNDSSRNLRRVKEKKEIVQPKTGKVTKIKITPTGDTSVPVKSSIRDKVAKKSSIVPLESKSFNKGSRNSLDNSSPVVSKRKPSKLSKSVDSPNNSKKLTRDLEVEVTVPDLASQPEKGDDLSPALCDSNTAVNDQQDSEIQTVEVVDSDHGDDLHQQIEEKTSLEIVVEGESIIPSKFTEEIEEFQELPVNDDDTPQLASLENAAPIENPRVRLSLSQMLQEENSEPDNIDWGIAENPPMMNYQRGAPKGFKRLLKFARKSKGEANLAGWSSPSVVSEGEDDSEESKSLNTKKADNLLMKATHNSGLALVKASLDKTFDHEKLYSGTYGAHNFSSKFQESHDHATVSSTKVGRSFFSLSAFRGSK